MNVALRIPQMTREEFLDWAEAQEEPYEFDGFRPVPMNGGLAIHFVIALAVYRTLHRKLVGGPHFVMALGAGIATSGNAVRFPDVFVTAAKPPAKARLMPEPLVAFEVVSPTSGRNDRIVKLAEYGAVPSIRRYVVLESDTVALTVFSRAGDGVAWLAQPLVNGGTLDLPELGIAIPIAEFYGDTDLAAEGRD